MGRVPGLSRSVRRSDRGNCGRGPESDYKAAESGGSAGIWDVTMDYDGRFIEALDGLRAEGRYRVFMDIQRLRGAFPYALLREADGAERRITVWCGNDYLGMGQNPAVLDAMKRAVDAAG